MESCETSKEQTQEAFMCAEKTVTAQNTKEVQEAYSLWAKNYDKHIFEIGFKIQREAARVCLSHIEDSKSSSVLDVASGTGAVAFHLRKNGNFVGLIDIMDANMEMLYVASKKEIHLRTITCHWIKEELPFRENSYDAVTCIGSLHPNHIPTQSVKGMLKVVKRGGFLIFNLRNRHAGDDIYISELQEKVDEWIKDKVLELVEIKEFRHLANVDDLLTQLYVYRKL